MSSRRGPPKHQNEYAWKPKAGIKINETEVGGRFRPLPAICGVCQRCKDQIDWKRRYGKYKPLTEPAKCQHCSKRAVRHAYHNLCSGCAKEQKVCAKCQCRVDQIVGRDSEDVEAEQKMLEDAIKNARERDRRTLLRSHQMGKAKPKNSAMPPTTEGNKVGDLFPTVSLEGYAAKVSGLRISDTNNKDLDEGEEDHYCDEQGEPRDEDEDKGEGDDSEEENGESESGSRVEQALQHH
ncbi:unnamed protein product [Linum tenue]|uniref:Uncharacterized protein n=1 Tax=Linum tenue TaxID=586396 RepID=A0AAV0N7U4_9ROSI|nr:unnamed protein product [Linum tenue]